MKTVLDIGVLAVTLLFSNSFSAASVTIPNVFFSTMPDEET